MNEPPKRCRIKAGTAVGQDFRVFTWRDESVVFNAEEFVEGRFKCVAKGYGVLHGNSSGSDYGNGALYPIGDDWMLPEQIKLVPASELEEAVRLLRLMYERVTANNRDPDEEGPDRSLLSDVRKFLEANHA